MEAIEEWRKLFEERMGGNIFEIAESAILVAACYYPEEFFDRRDRLAQTLFAKQNPTRRVYPSCFVDHEIEEKRSDHASASKSASPLLINNGGSKTEIHHNHNHDDEITSTKEKDVAIGVVGNGDGTTQPEVRRRHVIRINLKRYNEKKSRLARAAEEEEQKQLQKKEISEELQFSIAVVPDDKQGQVLNLTASKSPKKDLPVPENKEVQVLGAIAKPTMKKNSVGTGTETTRRINGDGMKPKSICAFDQKFEATKRKFRQEYKEFEDAKKKIRIIDLKDLPQQQQQKQKKLKPSGLGGFGCSNNRRKPGQQCFGGSSLVLGH